MTQFLKFCDLNLRSYTVLTYIDSVSCGLTCVNVYVIISTEREKI